MDVVSDEWAPQHYPNVTETASESILARRYQELVVVSLVARRLASVFMRRLFIK